MNGYDELSIYRGSDIIINRDIVITQPTIGQIADFGEKRYFNAVHTLTSVGADMKWQLWDMGIDYTQIEDYDLFIQLISQLVSSRKGMTTQESLQDEGSKFSEENLLELSVNPLQLVLKDIDLADFVACKKKDTDQVILYNNAQDITIDRLIYSQIVDVVRKIHGFKRNNEKPANEITKMDLIEDARDDALKAQKLPYQSVLKPLVSSLVNHSGFKYGHNEIWDMKINAFFDSVKRINKIQEAQLLMQGAYSGFASLKGVDKDRLNWTGTI